MARPKPWIGDGYREGVTLPPEVDLARDPAALRRALEASHPGVELDAVHIVRAPGRVNLIGEHTDYNDGFVLPAAIDLGVTIAFVPSEDRRVEIALAASGERDGFDLDAIGRRRGTWIDYIAGTGWALTEAGIETTGFRGIIAADLPAGAGLASSAALELAAAWALTGGVRPSVEPMSLARLAQRAENEYVGVNCGLMDQFAVVFGEAGRALFLDCRTLDHRAVAMPVDEIALVICHTGSSRRLETSAYNERREQCERAVAIIAESAAEVRALRDVTPELLQAAREHLDPIEFRRARHVVTENQRVVATVAAIKRGDLDEVGRLFADSHASLRDDFHVSSPELEALVEIAAATPGVVGARLTGAGFGGCTVNLVRRDAVSGLRGRILELYPARTGRTPTVWEVDAAAGVAMIQP